MLLLITLGATLSAQTVEYPIESLSVDGEARKGEGALQFIARLLPPLGKPDEAPLVYTVSMEGNINVTAKGLVQSHDFRAKLRSGKLEELVLNLIGEATIEQVTGEGVESWSERRLNEGGQRQLVIHLKEPLTKGEFAFAVTAEQQWTTLPADAKPLAFNLVDAGLLHGRMKVTPDSNVSIKQWKKDGLLELESAGADSLTMSFATDEQSYSLSFQVEPSVDAPSRFVNLELVGQWQSGSIKFTLSGEIIVDHPQGADLMLIDQRAAFLKLPQPEGAKIVYRNGAYRFVCEEAGTYPINGEFVARTETQNGRSQVRFGLAASALRPMRLLGFPVPIRHVRLDNSALEASGEAYVGYLPPSGMVNLTWTDPSWKTTDEEGKLFYTAESEIETTVGVGILRQRQKMRLSILQGGMREVTLWLSGEGEITRLAGPSVMNWKADKPDPEKNGARPVKVTFNRQQSESVEMEIELQTALGEFPLTAYPARLTADGAIRASGYWSLRNSGAVELAARSRKNLAQIAPEFLPSQLPQDSKQVLAYRFTGNDYSLELHVDNILPEIAVSEILLYHFGENDQRISAELECDIRRAPIRDFHLSLPAGYSISHVEAPALADYFVSGEENRQLRLLFSQPIEGKRLIRLRLERNEQLTEGEWTIPYLAPQDVKSVRGHIGVTAGPGLRLNTAQLDGLAEQVAAYFPQRVEDLRLALRLRQPDWSATLTVDKLSRSVQAESFHLITLAEGALYGSTIINYAIGDAPVDSLRVQLPDNYQNINFSGSNIRSWKALEDGVHLVDLQAAQTGAYTLLVTYEAKFTPQGARLSFGGVEPLAVEAEQGYIVVTSDYPFGISDIDQSSGLIPLEPNEIPSEFRLLYESQVLAAYQYTRRPLRLSLNVAPFQPGATVNQVVDFTELTTRISGDGELLTTANYQLKSKGHPHFRLALPKGSELWSVTVMDKKVTPAADGEAILIPLPAGRSADTPIAIRLQWAAQAEQAERLLLETPRLDSPALLVNWTVNADSGYGLRYLGGDLRPNEETQLNTAMESVYQRVFGGGLFSKLLLTLSLLAIGAAIIGFSWAKRCQRPNLIRIGAVLCLLFGLVVGAGVLATQPTSAAPANTLQFTTPLEQSSTHLSIRLSNMPTGEIGGHSLAWIGVALGVVLIAVGLVRKLPLGVRRGIEIAGWLLALWSALHVGGSPVLFGLVVLAVMARFLFVPTRSVTPAAAALAVMLLGLVDPTSVDAKSIVQSQVSADTMPIAPPQVTPEAIETNQQIKVDDEFAVVSGSMTWEAEAGEIVPFLDAPAILQSADLPSGVSLLTDPENQRSIKLLTSEAGKFSVSFSYHVRLKQEDVEHSVILPLAPALVNRGEIHLGGDQYVVQSEQAVQLEPLSDEGNRWKLLFRPSEHVIIAWTPKSRDIAKEDVIFFAESFDVYQPLAGIVEGAHLLSIRPSQGMVEQLSIRTPKGLTVTSVETPNLDFWRFDPDKQTVDLYFQPGQTGDFSITLRSQYTSEALPYRQSVEPLTLPSASDQIALIALATNDEVQIGEVNRELVSAINLEDFPAAALRSLKQPGNEPVVRRAFRWTGAESQLTFAAQAVLPDIRVTSNERLSYGEDRTLLSSQLEVEVSRAGVFELSFVAPKNFDMESISGEQLSHWNESPMEDGGRLITLQLKRKLLGKAFFALTLTGPGLATQSTVSAPRVLLHEAGRQTGAVAILPELGYRLSATERQAISQLDPKEHGLHEARAQLYRYLNDQGSIAFKVDIVPPWIEVSQHQSVTIRSGMIENRIRAEFSVENAGVRELLVQTPEDSLGVRFTGEALDRFEAVEGEPGQWRLHLDRKRIGRFILEADYQRATPQQPDEETLVGFQILEINQTSGFLSLATQGRLESDISQAPDSLQPAEMQMIPPKLRFKESERGVARVFRVLNPDFRLPVKLVRRDSAKTLPAQVESAQLTTVIADSGAAITRVRIALDPGDKRFLRLRLPTGSKFWYAFINSQSTMPWSEGDELILQLEPIPANEEAAEVEFYYSVELPVDGRNLNEQLIGPRIDLPMESIEWQVFYPESWNVEEWAGNLAMEETSGSQRGAWFDLSSYATLSTRSAEKKTKEAKSRLEEGNKLLATGQQVAARKAFEDAYNLSENDAAFNEDARVQLQTLREQQALVGLAQRRNVWSANNANVQMEVPQVDMLQYRQQEAQQILQGNSMEDNAALREVAREVLQQQQAALARPQALLTTMPELGKSVRFTRSLQVNDKAELVIGLSGTRAVASHFWENLGLLVILLVFVLILKGLNHMLRRHA